MSALAIERGLPSLAPRWGAPPTARRHRALREESVLYQGKLPGRSPARRGRLGNSARPVDPPAIEITAITHEARS
jgi:hypothetical protein